MAGTGEDKSKIVIYFRSGGHGGARIAGGDFLLYTYRRRDAVYQVHVRLAHPAQELPGIRGQAFGETPLAFRKKGFKYK